MIAFSSGRTRADLETDELYSLAVIRLIEIIGEAVKAIPDAIRNAHPDIPWRQIARTRDRLIHGYFDVDFDIIWNIISINIPVLLTEVEGMLASP